MKVLVLANNDVGLYKFRRQLLEAMVSKGYEVVVSVPEGDFSESIKATGCCLVPIEFNRRGKNPLGDLKLLNTYKRLCRKYNPDVVLTYTIKPNIYGGLAASKYHISCIANVTGLGTSIENDGLLKRISLLLYRIGLRHDDVVFFQNLENEQFFVSEKIVFGRHKLLPGSGVSTADYPAQPYPIYEKYGDVFLFVGRVMRDKGIEEFVETARRIRTEYSGTRFMVVGAFDEDYVEYIQTAQVDGFIEYLGQQRDTLPFYAQCSAVVLPSYHEGMANVLLEAASCGRPVLASNIPGCRETFDEGITGIGFEPRNVESLVDAIKKFIDMPYEKKVAMGKAARKKMENEFDRQIVVDAYLNEIEKTTRK